MKHEKNYSVWLKIFIGAAIVCAAFTVAAGSIGVRLGDNQIAGRNMMYRQEKFYKFEKEDGERNERHGVSRVFGAITKVESNQITIMNNAAKEEVVWSMATTVIMSSSTEVGLAALHAGQNIVVFGTLNKNNQLEAKLITIQ